MNSYPTFNKNLSQAAFTLTEIIVAISIISISMTGILAIYPLAMNTARDSFRETHATLIAESLFADLKRSSGNQALLYSGSLPSGTHLEIPLHVHREAPGETIYLAYDENATPLPSYPDITQNLFHSGLTGNAIYIVQIKSTYNSNAHPESAHIHISIQTPASAPENARIKYNFATLLTPR